MQHLMKLMIFMFAVAAAQIGSAAVTTPTPTPSATSSPAPKATAKASAEGMTVAVINFDAPSAALQETGRRVAELVRTKLGEGGLRVVSGEEVNKILAEQKMAISDVNDYSVPRVGALLGARVVVTGRILESSGGLVVTSKAIGAETGRVYTGLVSGEPSNADKLGRDLGAKMLGSIEKGAESFIANIRLSGDELAKLKKDLGDGPLPRVFVAVREQVAKTRVPDPAAQTQFGYILRKMRIEIGKDQNAELREWVNKYWEGSQGAPPKISSTEIIIVGEGIAEPATRAGDMVSSRARVELKAFDIRTGKLLASDRETQSATGINEALASKAALEQAAARIACRILPEAIGAWRTTQTKVPANDTATTRSQMKSK